MEASEHRPLFEAAALAHYEKDPSIAGTKLGEALRALYNSLNIPSSIEKAITETERWFSFFGWWYSARLLQDGKSEEAWDILLDLRESFSPGRAEELGIIADYGEQEVASLYSLTVHALELIQGNDLQEASVYAGRAADLQYRLAIERAGHD